MTAEYSIAKRVHELYWQQDINCASTVLKILAERYQVELHPQFLAAAVGLHGAGGFGAQCGLVEGGLLFIGLLGQQKNWDKTRIIQCCKDFAGQFSAEFSSLRCSELRPEGFSPDNPPHLCESMTVRALEFTVGYLKEWIAPNYRE